LATHDLNHDLAALIVACTTFLHSTELEAFCVVTPNMQSCFQQTYHSHILTRSNSTRAPIIGADIKT